MKIFILILSVLCVVLFSLTLNANPNISLQRWDTIDLQPAVAFHSGAPVRIKVDKIVSVSPMVGVTNAKINNAVGYSIGATTISINSISSTKPTPGQKFSIGSSGEVYTMVSGTDITGGMTLTFTPPLLASVPNGTAVVFRKYYTAVHFDFDRIYYDQREYHEIIALLNRQGWGDSMVDRYVFP